MMPKITLRVSFFTTEELRLFAYQIIWNMLASSYKDDDSTELDDLKLKMELTAYGETWQGTTEVETWKWHFWHFQRR